MTSAVELLHELAWRARRYRYDPLWEHGMPGNCVSGIYLLFEEGEFFHGGDRIVHVGSHTGANNLKNRLKEHYITENHHRSILRKHIGRAILNQRTDSYLSVWNIDYTYKKNKELYSCLRDKEKEAQIEREVSQYLRSRTSFCLIAEEDKQVRKKLEAGLLALLARATSCVPSKNWLGLWMTDARSSEAGLWNVQGLNGVPLRKEDIYYLSEKFVI